MKRRMSFFYTCIRHLSVPGKGLHSSTLQLNLRRFPSLKCTATTHRVPQKQFTSYQKVDECNGLPLVHFSAQLKPLPSLEGH